MDSQNLIFPHYHCPICGECLPILDIVPRYVIHLIDAHWDHVTRIHETTDDEEARKQLVMQLTAERAAAQYPESAN